MSAPRQLIMYTRPDCGLCERMQEQLGAAIADADISVTVVDIEGNEDLERRFGDRIPVLYFNGAELCFGRLDMDLLEEALAGNR